jgi:hypothetical protein
MAAAISFYKLTQGTVPIESFLFGHGTRVLHGTSAPVTGVTGRGRAGTGSLYILADLGNSGIYENTGTKRAPVWTVRVAPGPQ